MREIKFQVFTEDRKGVKKCFDCYYLYLLEEIPLSFGTPKDGRWYKVAFTNSEGDKETVVVDRDKIRMFTGLKDKNGKEIYEGDILLLHQFLFDGHEFENELIGEVVYDQETCSFALRNIRNADVKKYMGYKVHEDCGNIPIFNFYGLHEESFEKLGDIYENPELLEGGFK